MVACALEWLDVRPEDRVLRSVLQYGEFHPAAGSKGSKRGRG